MKKLLVGLLVIVCLFAVGYNAYHDQKNREEKFVVAVNIPLSGSFSRAFKGGFVAFKSGIEDELKAQGISLDKVYIDEGDNKLNSTEAITIFNKQEVSGFDAYYVAEAGTFNAVLPKLKQSGKPVFFISASERLFKEGAPNTIRLFPHLSMESPVYNRFIQHRKAKDVMFIGSNVIVADEEYNNFIKPYCEQNELNCYAEMFSPAEKDFRTIALKVKDKSPDVVFIYASPDALYQLASEFKSYHIDLNKVLMTPVFLEVALNDEFSVEVKKDILFVNFDFYSTKAMSESGFLEQDWVKSYMKEFGSLPMIYYYESGRLLARGFVKYGKNVTAENIMELTPYQSVIGEVVMDKRKKELISTYSLSKVNDKGEIEEVKWESIK